MDEETTEEEFTASRQAVWTMFPDLISIYPDGVDRQGAAIGAVLSVINPEIVYSVWRAIDMSTSWVSIQMPKGQRQQLLQQIRFDICAVIHEVIGNPFQKWSRTAPWSEGGLIQPDGRTVVLTDTVRGLAETVHQLQAFDRLPILADALEEAGITDAALLAHCRSEQPHLRGCWALDVVRGKT